MAPLDVLASQGRRQATAHAGAALSPQQREARDELRRSLRQRRRSLSVAEREGAAQNVLRHLQQWRVFRCASRIAAYDAVAAELPTAALQAHIQSTKAELYLPCLPFIKGGRMRFVRSQPDTRWRLNRYAIAEPIADQRSPAINPAFLDLILLPLVAFDKHGNRMGMGAGYYDRTLELRRWRRHWKRPLLIGLAYGCQQVDVLPTAPWDVPMDAIVTENGIITPH